MNIVENPIESNRENSGLFNMTCKAGVLMSHYTLIIYFTSPHVPV